MIRLYEDYTDLKYGRRNGSRYELVGEIGDWSFGFDTCDDGDEDCWKNWVNIDFFKTGEKHHWYSPVYYSRYGMVEAQDVVHDIWRDLCKKYQESAEFGEEEIVSVLKSYNFRY